MSIYNYLIEGNKKYDSNKDCYAFLRISEF